MQTTTKVKFQLNAQEGFAQTLRQRVNNYFEEKKLSKHGDWRMHIKAIIMLTIYVTPLVLVYTNQFPFYINALLYMTTGFAIAGIGMGVMHDAAHGAYSSKSWINELLASTMYLMGGSPFTWKMQHNILHHTYTNIPGHDEDIAGKNVVRLDPQTPWEPKYQTQHIYAFGLYTLLTFNKVLAADFVQLFKFNKIGVVEQAGGKLKTELAKLIVAKTVYVFLMFILPIAILGITTWHVLLGFLLMHMVAGITLACVFQLAHVVEAAAYPMPNEEGNIEDSWLAHQLRTTVNFGNKSAALTWFTGGLNHQVEHHLFPHISSVHYSKLAPIVKATAAEYGLPYHEFKTFGQALYSHYMMLKKFGQNPALEAA